MRSFPYLLVSVFAQVIFDGEEAVDAGGVTKEFFLLLLKELMDPDYGMFTFHNESNLLWFSDKVRRFSMSGFLLQQNINISLIGDSKECVSESCVCV